MSTFLSFEDEKNKILEKLNKIPDLLQINHDLQIEVNELTRRSAEYYQSAITNYNICCDQEKTIRILQQKIQELTNQYNTENTKNEEELKKIKEELKKIKEEKDYLTEKCKKTDENICYFSKMNSSLYNKLESKDLEIKNKGQELSDKTKEYEEQTNKFKIQQKEFEEQINKIKAEQEEEDKKKIVQLNTVKEEYEKRVNELNAQNEEIKLQFEKYKNDIQQQTINLNSRINELQMQKEENNNNLQILREIQKKEEEEENIKNKKEEEAREIIKNMRINSTVIRNTSSSPLIFYQKRQNTNNTFEVMIYCNDERCSFIGIHNPQVNSNNRYIDLQVIQNHFAIFNLLPGTYHVCSYSKESLENIGFVEMIVQPQM